MKKRNIAKINQKKIRTTIIIIILLAVFEIFEICVYNKVFNKNEVLKYEKNIVALNNSFYDIDYLLVNKYITIIRTSEQKKYSTNELTNPYMIQIKNNIVYVANDLNLNDKDIKLIKASGIEGTPKVVKYLNYESRSSFYVLTKENDLYYADTTIKGESNIVNQFQKINDKKITNIYDFYTDENITYPWSPLTIYGETENKGLLKVKLDNITTTFKEDYALLDQICGGWSEENYCVGLFISPDRNLYLMKDEIRKTYKEILYKEKSIEVKDAFSVADIRINQDDSASLGKIKYYIIGKDNYLYEIIENNRYEVVSVNKYNDSKILSYEYSTKDGEYSASINYKNGEKDYFKDVSVFSSLYYRYNILK